MVILLTAACAEPTWAPDTEVQKAIRPYDGQPKLTLFTVQSTLNGSGAHSSLMVSGAHRALFDPAGTFRMPGAPERNDVIFGVTDQVLSVYIDYHARETYNVLIQEVPVSRDTAARALRLIQDHGPTPKAHCNVAVTRILSQLSEFSEVPRGYYPNRTAEWLAAHPGSNARLVTDDDADDNHGVLIAAGAPPRQ